MNEKGATFDYRGVFWCPIPRDPPRELERKEQRCVRLCGMEEELTAGKPGVKRMGEQKT